MWRSKPSRTRGIVAYLDAALEDGNLELLKVAGRIARAKGLDRMTLGWIDQSSQTLQANRQKSRPRL